MQRDDTQTRQSSNTSLPVKERYSSVPRPPYSLPFILRAPNWVYPSIFVLLLYWQYLCPPLVGVGGENRGGHSPGAAAEKGRRQETDSWRESSSGPPCCHPGAHLWFTSVALVLHFHKFRRLAETYFKRNGQNWRETEIAWYLFLNMCQALKTVDQRHVKNAFL